MHSNAATLGQFIGDRLFTVRATATVAQAMALARASNIHHIPVLDDERLVGLVCTCDLLEAPADSSVSHWMSYPAAALDVADTTLSAARLMSERRVGSVVITRGGVACGIVTRGDVLSADPAATEGLTTQRCESCGSTRPLSATAAVSPLCLPCRQARFEAPLAGADVGAPSEWWRGLDTEAHPLASLIQEHRVLGALADGLEQLALRLGGESGSVGRRDLSGFVRVFRDLGDCVHHEKEEYVLLPALVRDGCNWEEGPVAESRREHWQERYLVNVLGQFAEMEQRWDNDERRRLVSTAIALAEFQRQHIRRENDTLFPLVMNRMSAEKQSELREALNRFDARVELYLPHRELKELAGELIQRYRPAAVASSAPEQAA